MRSQPPLMRVQTIKNNPTAPLFYHALPPLEKSLNDLPFPLMLFPYIPIQQPPPSAVSFFHAVSFSLPSYICLLHYSFISQHLTALSLSSPFLYSSLLSIPLLSSLLFLSHLFSLCFLPCPSMSSSGRQIMRSDSLSTAPPPPPPLSTLL